MMKKRLNEKAFIKWWQPQDNTPKITRHPQDRHGTEFTKWRKMGDVENFHLFCGLTSFNIIWFPKSLNPRLPKVNPSNSPSHRPSHLPRHQSRGMSTEMKMNQLNRRDRHLSPLSVSFFSPVSLISWHPSISVKISCAFRSLHQYWSSTGYWLKLFIQ